MDRIGISLFYVTIALLLLYVSASPPNITADQFALVTLKSHLSLSFGSILAINWSTAAPVCSWIGITCDSRHHRVTGVNMSNLQLIGTIPPHLGNLSFLTSLDMSNNSLYGPIPHEIGDLHHLTILNLWHNQLIGPIPLTIFNISSLETIDLTKTNLSGTLPVNICHHTSQLKELYLGRNSLVGTIPSSIGKCSQLESLTMFSNNIEGEIPEEMGNLQQLQFVSLEFNDLVGPIPTSLFNISTLEVLALSDNYLSVPINLSETNTEGEIQEDIGNLQQLQGLYLGNNDFTGSIPTRLFNISTLEVVALELNYLLGNLPLSLSQGVPNLSKVTLGENNLSGVIPNSISNASQLTVLDLSSNSFRGPIPHSLGNLRLLTRLRLRDNNFQHASSSSALSFLSSLTKCRNLEKLYISLNPFGGVLPSSIGNFSKTLKEFSAHSCKLKGEIPEEIGQLSNLTYLALHNNELTGSIPVTIKGLKSLQQIYIDNNNITGPIPDNFCHLKYLGRLSLAGNDISGPLPQCLGNITLLRELYLASNRLTSLPTSLWNLQDLLILNASSNRLSGHLPPEIGNLRVVTILDLSMNNFSGNIPSTMGGLQNLINLSFVHNRLEGPIPASFGKLLSLVALDMSYNSLNGELPKSLVDLKYLSYFNVSFNKLSGEIPNAGPFLNFTSQSFMSNGALCGASRFQVRPCYTSPKSRRKRVYITIYILCGVVGVILVLILGLLLIRWQRKERLTSQLEIVTVMRHARISFFELEQATTGFNESNLLGKGNYGAVYKGVLHDGTLVAVKVFDTQMEGATRSFDIECEALCNLRHRNLTKVITSCSNAIDFKSLVLEYMPNGSLEKWLYSYNYFLNILQRLNIMIDVAYALDYLHNGYSMAIVHCDLKPSNVLLNEDMVGHVSDFGISKLLGRKNSVAWTKTLATIGYMAPEYGQEGLVSTKCDIYSFGIMMMETFTRVKPNDKMFVEDLSLRGWVSDSIPSSITHVIDANLVRPDEQNFKGKVQCLLSIMQLALRCTIALPKDRLDVKDVVAMLEKIRTRLEE